MNPRLHLAQLPTPIEILPRLSAKLGGPKILIKRDDLTGAGLGGNKVRKLEYLLAEALANGAKTLITTGASQSNHARQTAALAARLGFGCILVLSREMEGAEGGNLLLDEIFGAEIIWCEKINRQNTLQAVFQECWKNGRRPYLIPMGGSTPVGTLGYFSAFEEFITQKTPAKWIILASSSGGTQAGLELGRLITGWDGRILGINVGSEEIDLQARIADLCAQASERIGEARNVNREEIILNGDYCQAGYGNPNEKDLEALRLFARLEGILLDPVYSARAAAGMIDLIRKGFFDPKGSILFWHTGGIPAIFSDKYASLF